MIARVELWGRTIGAVSMEEGRDVAAFQYDHAFAASGIGLSPVTMPLSERVYTFPTLPKETFHGLPGLLADSLPDRFGNALIDAWLATQGRTAGSFSAIERLCYTGARGMGALELAPALGPKPRKAARIEVDALVRLAGEVLRHRGDMQGHFHGAGKAKALQEILRVGTSAEERGQGGDRVEPADQRGAVGPDRHGRRLRALAAEVRAPDDFLCVSRGGSDRPAARAWARRSPPGSFIRRAGRG